MALMTTCTRPFINRLQTISMRYASSRKQKPSSGENIERQSQSLVSLIESEQTEMIDSFIDKNGAINNVEDAYKIQENVSFILENEYKDKYSRMGYKIGGTANNIKSIWNISEPFVSPFYNVWKYKNNKIIEKEKGLTVGVESEFIFKIGETLNIENINNDEIVLNDIYPLIDSISPGFELIETRITDKESIFKLPIEYLISDLCWTGGIVIGPESTLSDLKYSEWKKYDENELKDAAVEIYINSDQKGIGYGREVLGSPFNALLFIYNFLLKKGQTIKEGQYISTGTVTGCNFLNKNDIAESVFENIGDVEFKIV